ncbi:hypothetical protein ACFYYY_25450 [Streptomyces sp. NPDC001834]|uniref:hypothetical protein n=1 Tax=Streptomyces sp. NPDC001834 TaxID=3364616 RepID=UPI0036C95173
MGRVSGFGDLGQCAGRVRVLAARDRHLVRRPLQRQDLQHRLDLLDDSGRRQHESRGRLRHPRLGADHDEVRATGPQPVQDRAQRLAAPAAPAAVSTPCSDRVRVARFC